jgi:uncharacterized protein (TIGR02118 family)
MSYRIAVCYGQPADPAAFDTYYTQSHIPLVQKVPGLSAFTWGKCEPLGSTEPPFYLVASLHFPTAEAMQDALASDEMRQTGRDLRNFASGGVTMFTQHEESANDS